MELNVDNHHTALGLFAGWSHHRLLAAIAIRGDWKLRATALVLAAPLLFFLQDLFDNPGIQHGGPPFRDGVSTLTLLSTLRSSSPLELQPAGLGTLIPARSF